MAVVFLTNGMEGECWWWRIGAVDKPVVRCRAHRVRWLGLGGSGASGGRVAGSWEDLRYWEVGGLVMQWYWMVARWRAVVSVAGVELWPVGQWVAVDWGWAFCQWRTSGVQRAVWVGVVLLISHSIKERLIIGVGGGAEVGDADGKVGERVAKVVGLSGWVGVVCWVIVISSSSIGVMGRVGRFSLSSVVLALGEAGAWLGVLFKVLGVVGGSERESDWVSGG